MLRLVPAIQTGGNWTAACVALGLKPMLFVFLLEAQVVLVKVLRVFGVVEAAEVKAKASPLGPEESRELTLKCMEGLPLPIVLGLVVVVTMPRLSPIGIKEVCAIIFVTNDDLSRERDGPRVWHK